MTRHTENVRQTDAAELAAIDVFKAAQAAGEPVTHGAGEMSCDGTAGPSSRMRVRALRGCGPAYRRKSNARVQDYFFSTLRQEDDGLVHLRVEVELPVHPSYLTDAASGQTLAKDVGLDVTAN